MEKVVIHLLELVQTNNWEKIGILDIEVFNFPQKRVYANSSNRLLYLCTYMMH